MHKLLLLLLLFCLVYKNISSILVFIHNNHFDVNTPCCGQSLVPDKVEDVFDHGVAVLDGRGHERLLYGSTRQQTQARAAERGPAREGGGRGRFRRLAGQALRGTLVARFAVCTEVLVLYCRGLRPLRGA